MSLFTHTHTNTHIYIYIIYIYIIYIYIIYIYSNELFYIFRSIRYDTYVKWSCDWLFFLYRDIMNLSLLRESLRNYLLFFFFFINVRYIDDIFIATQCYNEINRLKQTLEKNSQLNFTTEHNINKKNSLPSRFYWFQQQGQIPYIPIQKKTTSHDSILLN